MSDVPTYPRAASVFQTPLHLDFTARAGNPDLFRTRLGRLRGAVHNGAHLGEPPARPGDAPSAAGGFDAQFGAVESQFQLFICRIIGRCHI